MQSPSPSQIPGVAGSSGAQGAAEGGGGTSDAVSESRSIGETLHDTVVGVWDGFVERVPFLIAGLGIVLLTWGVAALFGRFSDRIFQKAEVRRSRKDLFKRLFTIAIWIVGLLIAAMVVFPGMTPSRALAGLGLVSVAVGLAFKDIFENFFAGILILWRFPFEVGDFIECEGILGRVQDVTIRNTLIRRTSGELVVVPNSTIYKNPVDVLTDWRRRRVTIVAGVAYGEDVAASVGVIQQAVEGCESVDKDSPIQVFPQGFGSSSIDIEVAWWTGPEPVDVRRSRGEVVTAIKSALDEAGIEIPFPYRTLTFKEPLHVEGDGGVNGEDGEDRASERPGAEVAGGAPERQAPIAEIGGAPRP
jgi:small-conductance mechanosensitive channel